MIVFIREIYNKKRFKYYNEQYIVIILCEGIIKKRPNNSLLINIFNRTYDAGAAWKLRKVILRCFFLHPRRLFNILANKISKLLKSTHVIGMPSTMMIEPTSFCNLQCGMCGKNQYIELGVDLQEGHMRFENFTGLINEVYKYVFTVFLWNYGEPFLNKDVFKMVQYLRDRDIITAISTNGNLLDQQAAVRLVNSGLSYLVISLDGTDEESYNKIRKGGSYEKVIKGIENIITYRDQKKSLTPYVDLQFVVMRDNEEKVEEMFDLGRKLKVDRVTLKKCQISLESLREQFLPVNREFRYNCYDGMDNEIQSTCYRLFEHSSINWDGHVFPCCDIKDPECSMGNCFETKSFKAIWNGTLYQQFRKNYLENKKYYICKKCPGKAQSANLDL